MTRQTRTGKPTEEEIDEIAELLLTREYGGKQIGEIVGRTKGSIMGIIWRTPRLKKIGLPNPPLVERMAALKAAKQKTNTPPLAPELPPVIQTGPRTLMEMQAIHCKFPLWAHNDRPDPKDMLFCCETRLPDNPYCDKHHKLCVSAPYQKVAKLKQVA